MILKAPHFGAFLPHKNLSYLCGDPVDARNDRFIFCFENIQPVLICKIQVQAEHNLAIIHIVYKKSEGVMIKIICIDPPKAVKAVLRLIVKKK